MYVLNVILENEACVDKKILQIFITALLYN